KCNSQFHDPSVLRTKTPPWKDYTPAGRISAAKSSPGLAWVPPLPMVRASKSRSAFPMKAMLCKEYGPPETLVLSDVPSPQAGPGQVVVSVKACGVNFP